jgi:REP element-mobilizing transposase RayT
MWCLFRSARGSSCTGSCDGIWEKYFAGWRSRRRAGSKKEHLMSDHVHMMIAIPPKYALSQVIGFIKGKSAIRLAQVYGEGKRNFVE